VAQLNNQVIYDRYRDIASDDIIVSDEHPSVIFVKLNQRMIKSLIRFCRKFWAEEEMRFLERFIQEENSTHGVLLFKGRKQFDPIHY